MFGTITKNFEAGRKCLEQLLKILTQGENVWNNC